MSTALIYRPNNHKLTWVAFECAITIYLSAIAIAGNRAKPPPITWWGDPQPSVEGIDSSSPPPEIELIAPAEPPTIVENADFSDENVTRTPIRPRKKTLVIPIRSANIGNGQAANAGSVKALTLYAPKPSYPYEARRGGVTGSGVAQLIVNSIAGNVIDARMSRSTGSAILDGVTVDALRRWRFRPGVASNVEVPVTFSLTGVSY